MYQTILPQTPQINLNNALTEQVFLAVERLTYIPGYPPRISVHESRLPNAFRRIPQCKTKTPHNMRRTQHLRRNRLFIDSGRQIHEYLSGKKTQQFNTQLSDLSVAQQRIYNRKSSYRKLGDLRSTSLKHRFSKFTIDHARYSTVSSASPCNSQRTQAVSVTTLQMAYTVTGTQFYQRVLYFRNVIRFYSASVRDIPFTPIIKVRPCLHANRHGLHIRRSF